MRRTRTPTKLTQNTYNGKVIGITNAPTRLQAEGCWGLGEITTAISNGTAALDEASTWPPNHVIVEYMVIAGGGGAGVGGGGAGGKLEGTDGVITLGTHACTVGAGGADEGVNGSESSIGSLYVAEGGGGGNAKDGGSGAGGYWTQGSFGEGIAGQGNDGGATILYPNRAGGGGGGAGQAGQNCQSEVTGGNGGNGEADSITGSSVTYCGGGGGGAYTGSAGSGGSGGGGNGSVYEPAANPTDGSANLAGGGGGKGGHVTHPDSGVGGSGIIVIRYKGDKVFSGGTEGTTGDYKLHTFTSTADIILGGTG